MPEISGISISSISNEIHGASDEIGRLIEPVANATQHPDALGLSRRHLAGLSCRHRRGHISQPQGRVIDRQHTAVVSSEKVPLQR